MGPALSVACLEEESAVPGSTLQGRGASDQGGSSVPRVWGAACAESVGACGWGWKGVPDASEGWRADSLVLARAGEGG